MPQPPDFQYDVFLSHNHADKPRVRRLAERLKAAGVRVWLDEWVIQAGDIIALKVDEGLEQSRVLLLCISPAALASGWVALERSTAVHRDPANAGRRFIPLLLGECELPYTLRRYKYLDFREESAATYESLLQACCAAQDQEGHRSDQNPVATLTRQWDVESDRPLALATGSKKRCYAVVLRREDALILDVKSGKQIGPLKGLRHIPTATGINRDGTNVITGSSEGYLQFWNLQKCELLLTIEISQQMIQSVAFLSDGRRVIASSADGVVQVFDPDARNCCSSIRPSCIVTCVAIASDDTTAFIGGEDGSLSIWNIWTKKRVAVVKAHRERIDSIAIAPDGLFVVTVSTDATIKIWGPSGVECIGILEGHTEDHEPPPETFFSNTALGFHDFAPGEHRSITVSPDSKLIASTGFTDREVRIWSRDSGECLHIIDYGLNEVAFPILIAFSEDSECLIVATTDGTFLDEYHLTGIATAASADPAHRYVNAKVVLLGEGMVGKTSLAHRLIKDEFVICARTHGMNVWPLELPLPANDALDREALLWDLAGQEDSRLIHQLFLEETSLALLLINAQDSDPFFEAGDWLKALKTAANNLAAKREAKRLLIFSQIDVGGMKLSNSKIDRFCEQNGFADWIATGAESGKNCSDRENGGYPSELKQLIAKSIPWDKLPWTSTPRLLAELKNAVMAMRDESDIRLLRFSELAQRLEQALPGEKFGEPAMRTAVTLLANHGLARPLKFGDLVLLRPDLINGYAGAVIRAARAHTDEIGCVLEADIYRLDFDFTGVERLKHRPDEELLLRALVQTFLDHSLCIAEDTPHGRHLVFPSQYRREKDLPHEPDIFVSYTFSGEWQTVWTTLVVRLWYSQEFAHRELWRNAAEFESARKQTLGLKITKTGDGAATISLYFDMKVPDELKVIFIEYVHRHLAKYACEVTRDRRYVCPDCGKPVKDLDAVRRRLEAKKDFINCQECDDVKVPFIDFIEQRLKSDPVARKILAMDETATRELDTQALEQILIGHMMAIAGEANQIFRPVTMFDHGIDGEVEFKDNDGKASGKRIYIQLKSGNSYLRTRKGDGSEVFDVKDDRHLEYWISQPVDVYLVIRQTDELNGQQVIRWMNVTRYLKARKDKRSRQIIFTGEKLDMEAVWKVRDGFFPPR